MSCSSFSVIPNLNTRLFSNRFAQIDGLFSKLTGESPIANSPSYNLLQMDKENYKLILSVPGYKKDEIEMTVLNNQLTISSKLFSEQIDNNDEKMYPKFIHQGIIKNEFSLSFSLHHRINIQQTYMDNGQLIVEFIYDIPEEYKPKKIAVGFQRPSSKAISDHVATS